MRFSYLFSFVFVLTFSACIPIADIEPTTPVQIFPTQTNDDGFAVPNFSTLEPEKDSTQLILPTPSYSLENLINKAKEGLAKRLFISTSQIHLVDAKEIVWPDASLGCPQPGMMYAQVLTPGFSVQLEAQGQIYEYHTDLDGNMMLCDSVIKGNSPSKDSDKNVDDGWPNETKDNDVIITTPTK